MRLQLLILLLLVGCFNRQDKEFFYGKDPTEVFYIREFGQAFSQSEETITVEAAEPVDILWNVDNSGSMGDNQAALANNFALFIEDFSQKNVDFKMAIITTDSSQNRDTNNKLNSAELASNRQDFINDFKTKIRVGIVGSAHEQSFAMTKGFLDSNTWVRSDASLVIISVSDEPEGSGNTVEHFKDAILAAKGGDAEKVRFFTICTRDACDRFETMSSDIGGGLVRYLDESFSDISTQFGDTIVRDLTNLQTIFPLGDMPADLTRMVVSINGSEVPRDRTGTDGWDYDEPSNSIEFFGSHIPPAGSSIDISWREEHHFCLKNPLDEGLMETVILRVNGQSLEESEYENLLSYDRDTNCLIFSGEIEPDSKVEITYSPDYTRAHVKSSAWNSVTNWIDSWNHSPLLAFVD